MPVLFVVLSVAVMVFPLTLIHIDGSPDRMRAKAEAQMIERCVKDKEPPAYCTEIASALAKKIAERPQEAK